MTLVRYIHPRTTALAPAFGRSPWMGLESDINRLLETALGDFNSPVLEHRFPVDLYEDKDNNYVRAELPGLTRDDIAIELVEGYLTINGNRKVTDDDGKVVETISLSRSISVPAAIVADKIAAAFEHGVLTVTLPKREEVKPKKVTITVN